ncbi:MAG: FAD-binding oxidoreductase [Hyphomicrobiales bacterium]|nr:FAD-binding oxidoreductase [Hyphomicrobiales bacterium]
MERPWRGFCKFAVPHRRNGGTANGGPSVTAIAEARAEAHHADIIETLKSAVGSKGYIADRHEMAPFLEEHRRVYRGAAQLVVRPASTAEVATVVKLCAAGRIPIFPQGGNTGLSGGAVPWEDGKGIVLSLGRMNRVRALDPLDHSITVDAGCILADVQKAAEGVDRLFPLSLGAEGSCQIGGNISTNAGGIATLRYGNMRSLVLGLEVVLPDGQVWSALRALHKDNSGYDLKQLFIGAEGTLGIITGATLRLFPRPHAVETGFLGLTRLEDAMQLFTRARVASGDQLTAFELIPRFGLEMAVRHVAGAADPLPRPYPWYVLFEMSTGAAHVDIKEMLGTFLAEASAADLVQDGVIAASIAQAQTFWRIREGLGQALKFEGASIKHDVSVPVSRVSTFIDQASAAATERLPGIRPLAFGHVGDGNIHFNLHQPVTMDGAAFLARHEEFNRLVHDIVMEFGGSISAEHGIGRLKVGELAHYKSAVELALMHRVKRMFDPHGIMNPGKILERTNSDRATVNATPGEAAAF